MPSNQPPPWRPRHDHDHHLRCRPRRALAERVALTGHQADLGQARRAIRQTRLAGGPLPRGACRARDGRPWRRRIERHLAEARLPAGKTLATFDFASVPMVSKAQVMALAAGDAWL